MLIVCPSCASSYNTPEEKLGPAGRTVRCKRCATTWFVKPSTAIDPFEAAMSSIEAAADTADEIAERAATGLKGHDPDKSEIVTGEAELAPETTDEASVTRVVEATGGGPDEALVEIDGEIVATSARAASNEETPEPAEEPTQGHSLPARISALATALGAILALPFRRARKASSDAAEDPPEAAPVAGISADNIIPSRRRSQPLPKPRARAPLAGRVAPYAAFAAVSIAVFLVAARGPIAGASPAMAKLYGAMGLSRANSPIAILNVASEVAAGDAGDVLLVEGEIVSRSPEQIQIPPLRVVVRDEKGVELYAWPAQSLKLALEPGERTVFRARLASPPPAGRTVQVRFEAAAGDARRPRAS
ncbi:MAG: MJ0042-type zinc finger domain-containing protein [Beijerinckiaceae bacterium]